LLSLIQILLILLYYKSGKFRKTRARGQTMPIYTYRREDGTTFELRQKFLDDPLAVDPESGQAVHRVIHAAGVIFKGSGYYVTDNRGANNPAAKNNANGNGSNGDSSSSTSSESTSETKASTTSKTEAAAD
jgi:putative FmdB family regulatory protein